MRLQITVPDELYNEAMKQACNSLFVSEMTDSEMSKIVMAEGVRSIKERNERG